MCFFLLYYSSGSAIFLAERYLNNQAVCPRELSPFLIGEIPARHDVARTPARAIVIFLPACLCVLVSGDSLLLHCVSRPARTGLMNRVLAKFHCACKPGDRRPSGPLLLGLHTPRAAHALLQYDVLLGATHTLSR